MNKLHYFIPLLLAALAFSCQQDDRERLFDMVYPNIRFDIPAGLSGGTVPRVFELDDLSTNIQQYLRDFDTDTSMITGISPFSASIQALDSGIDFDFVQEVSVRICPRNSESCNPAQEMFYIDRLQQERPGSEIELLPTLVNAKPYLSSERYKLEIWFYFIGTTPTRVDARLNMRFEALR